MAQLPPPPKHLRQFHPGIILLEHYITPYSFTQEIVCRHLKISAALLSRLCLGRSTITANLANRLSQVFDGTTIDYWLKLQSDYDAKSMKAQGLDIKCDKLVHIVKPYQHPKNHV